MMLWPTARSTGKHRPATTTTIVDGKWRTAVELVVVLG
jgi:hypothetical protein